MKYFNWDVNAKPSGQVGFKVNRSSFGDGYEQRSTIGINNRREAWSVAKIGDKETVIDPIQHFIDSLNGTESVQWANPKGERRIYEIGDYTMTQVSGRMWEITFTFTEAFDFEL